MKKPTIICVDDEKFVLSALKTQLKRTLGDRCTIEVAESAEEALEILEHLGTLDVKIPLVISDQIMPGIKGDQFLIKVHEMLPKTHKILLTGQADTIAIGNAVNKANLYRYIAKPWEESDMSLSVNEAVRSYFTDIKLEEQNAILKELNENLEKKVIERTNEIALKNKIIETKNQSIIDSIQYARTIEDAMLPPVSSFDMCFNQWFIYNRPRDIVSGDFYWLEHINDKIVVAVADCTGHGVPGAFMSMLGISLLNEIMRKNEITSASSILEELRVKIKYSLHQRGDAMETKDGMDIALCVIDQTEHTLQFAGAKNPLFIVRNGELLHFKGDYQPVAVYINERPFTNNVIPIQDGDVFYMYTDGIVDQFSSSGKKFTVKYFKELLMEMAGTDLKEQEEKINAVFSEWTSDFEQIDDVLIVGFQLK